MVRKDIIELLAANELEPKVWFAILLYFLCVTVMYDPALQLLGMYDER